MLTTRSAACVTAVCSLFCGVAAGSNSPADGEAVSCGVVRRLHSKILNEDRVLLLRLPLDYGTGGKRYPVLYKLDGSKDVFLETVGTVEYLVDKVDRFPDRIVVAIENTDRNRDMFPERGAADFDRFLTEELTPFIDANYRTNGTRILCGQSLSSVFALYSFLREPCAFDGYVLSSFGLSTEWLNLFEAALAKSAALAGRKTHLYVANGALDPYDSDGSRSRNGVIFLDSLSKAAASIAATWSGSGGSWTCPRLIVSRSSRWSSGIRPRSRRIKKDGWTAPGSFTTENTTG
jgi:uncharacterized protein